jgi:purine-binding chemotaxis protein CheW
MEAVIENKTAAELKSKSGVFQIIVFKQGDEEYALQIDQIKEVVITPTITRMPQTPAFIKGVANIRGNIIAIMDLEEMFNLRRTNTTEEGKNFTLVVESEDIKMGLLVREVPNTLSVNVADFDETVNVIQDASVDSNYIKGIIKSNGKLIILIDVFKVIDHEAMSQLKKSSK